jgi:phage shock protein C
MCLLICLKRRARRRGILLGEQTMTSRGLYRSRTHRLIAGVAGGMAERFGLPVLLVRLVWLILLVPGGLPGLVPYLICWLVIPSE